MTLPGYEPYPTAARPRGMGLTALVLGILALPTLPLCLLGMVVGLGGLTVGVVAFVKGNGRGLAACGMALSAVALVLGGLAVSWFLGQARECADTARYPDTRSREHCIERKFPFVDPDPKTLDGAGVRAAPARA